MELRRSNRYQLEAPAFFWWERSDGHLQESKGIPSRPIRFRRHFRTMSVPLPTLLNLDDSSLLSLSP